MGGFTTALRHAVLGWPLDRGEALASLKEAREALERLDTLPPLEGLTVDPFAEKVIRPLISAAESISVAASAATWGTDDDRKTAVHYAACAFAQLAEGFRAMPGGLVDEAVREMLGRPPVPVRMGRKTLFRA